jgi:DNA mismatch repair protein MutS2
MKKIKPSVKQELEFHKIIDLLIDRCESEKNKRFYKQLQPFGKPESLKQHFDLLRDFTYIQDDTTFPGFQYQDLSNTNTLLRIEASVLEVDDFFALLHTIDFSNKVFRYFKNNTVGWEKLKQLFSTISIEKPLVREILQIFNAQREIKSNASPALQEIRIKMNTCKRVSDQRFKEALATYGKEGFLADTKETFQDHTRLLAVLSEHKRKVNGKRYGESKSGAVAYIEPQACADVNKQYVRLLEDEKDEIRRILLALTDVFRDRKDWIKDLSRIIEKLDLLQANIRTSKLYDGQIPKISSSRKMEWKNAFHPLLLINYKDRNLKVHPQSIGLDDFQNMIVISGPNAGGKSISLKTVGLLQLMFQSGLTVPVQKDSTFCLVDEVFTDIGDNQSIENELSTYSHRLKKMKEILDYATPKSLVLIDEFGSGSDPVLGGALASVFFEELYKTGCFSVLTTHYGVIKLMAEEMSGVQNASMLFDEKKLKPLYKLQIGKPGSSFTFEVAKNMGIPRDLIQMAKAKVSNENMKYEELINQYQKLNTALEFEKENLRKKTKRTHNLKKEFDKRLEFLDHKEKRMVERLEEQERQLTLGKKMEKIIVEYKKGTKTREVFQRFKRLVETESKVTVEVKKKRPPVFKEREHAQNHEFKIGDKVKLVGGYDVGEIIELKKTKAMVLFGIIKTQLDLNKIEKATPRYKKNGK